MRVYCQTLGHVYLYLLICCYQCNTCIKLSVSLSWFLYFLWALLPPPPHTHTHDEEQWLLSYLWSFPFLQLNVPEERYFFLGLLCGLAFYNNSIVHMPFPLALFKKLLDIRPSLEDFVQLSPVIGRYVFYAILCNITALLNWFGLFLLIIYTLDLLMKVSCCYGNCIHRDLYYTQWMLYAKFNHVQIILIY